MESVLHAKMERIAHVLFFKLQREVLKSKINGLLLEAKNIRLSVCVSLKFYFQEHHPSLHTERGSLFWPYVLPLGDTVNVGLIEKT